MAQFEPGHPLTRLDERAVVDLDLQGAAAIALFVPDESGDLLHRHGFAGQGSFFETAVTFADHAKISNGLANVTAQPFVQFIQIVLGFRLRGMGHH